MRDCKTVHSESLGDVGSIEKIRKLSLAETDELFVIRAMVDLPFTHGHSTNSKRQRECADYGETGRGRVCDG